MGLRAAASGGKGAGKWLNRKNLGFPKRRCIEDCLWDAIRSVVLANCGL